MTHRERADSGFTLVEILVTVSIMSLGLVALVGGMVMMLAGTRVHRNATAVDNALRVYTDQITNLIPGQGGVPAHCLSAADYATAIPTPTGFNAPTIQVSYLVPSSVTVTTFPPNPITASTTPASSSNAGCTSTTDVEYVNVTLVQTATSASGTATVTKRIP